MKVLGFGNWDGGGRGEGNNAELGKSFETWVDISNRDLLNLDPFLDR